MQLNCNGNFPAAPVRTVHYKTAPAVSAAKRSGSDAANARKAWAGLPGRVDLPSSGGTPASSNSNLAPPHQIHAKASPPNCTGTQAKFASAHQPIRSIPQGCPSDEHGEATRRRPQAAPAACASHRDGPGRRQPDGSLSGATLPRRHKKGRPGQGPEPASIDAGLRPRRDADRRSGRNAPAPRSRVRAAPDATANPTLRRLWPPPDGARSVARCGQNRRAFRAADRG